MKPKTVSKLKKEAWALFSKYIRQKYADHRGYCKCVTCGTVREWKYMQGGHFIPGRHNSILFDEKNVHPQCDGCNRWKQGNTVKYFRFMERTYGNDEIKRLEKENDKTKSFTIKELEAFKEELKQKIKDIGGEM